jgi:predicted DNA-binding transcriptional regulator AlpA
MPDVRIKTIPDEHIGETERRLLNEARYRKDLMTLTQVAVHFGVSTKTVRRWIAKKTFPPAFIKSANGRRDLWLKPDIWAYQKVQFAREMPQSSRARIKSDNQLTNLQEQRNLRVDNFTLIQNKRQRDMIRILISDEKSFLKKHPSLAAYVGHREKYFRALKRYAEENE